MKTTIYIATHKSFGVPEQKIYLPLHVGHKCANADLGYLGDDSGENISDRNCYYGELTGLYWIWKNDKNSDYIGLCHYRRYFVDADQQLLTEQQFEKCFTKYDIIAAVSNTGEKNFYESYEEAHHIRDLDLTGEVLLEKYPEYEAAFQKVIYGRHGYAANLFVTSRQLFMEYAQWLFTILFEVEKRIDVEVYDDYHKRVFGFLSEQLLGVWIEGKGLKCLKCRIGIMQDKEETKELKIALQDFMNAEAYDQAVTYFEHIVEKRPDVLFKDSDRSGELQQMYQILTICTQEKGRGVTGLSAISHDLRELIKVKNRVDQILLHIWRKQGEDDDLIYIADMGISWVMIVARILNMIEFKDHVIPMLNCVAMYFFRSGYYTKVIPFLDYALLLNDKDESTFKNLVTVLEAYEEYELAELFKRNVEICS